MHALSTHFRLQLAGGAGVFLTEFTHSYITWSCFCFVSVHRNCCNVFEVVFLPLSRRGHAVSAFQSHFRHVMWDMKGGNSGGRVNDIYNS